MVEVTAVPRRKAPKNSQNAHIAKAFAGLKARVDTTVATIVDESRKPLLKAKRRPIVKITRAPENENRWFITLNVTRLGVITRENF